MQTISLFSGCGGMDLGAKAAGAKIIFANDSNQDACLTLQKTLKDAQVVHSSVIDIKSFPKADLVIGGYPCQSFSMGGNRNPKADSRTYLFLEFARCLEVVEPLYFVAENVSGLKKMQGGIFLDEQLHVFEKSGKYGYRVTAKMVDAKDYGVPQTRKRILLVGIRKDLEQVFLFPPATHGKASKREPFLKPYTSHGDAIAGLPLWPKGEFYERPHDPEGHFSWYYMSRNRKGKWDGPSFTIVSNWRHTPLHPGGPVMKLTWSNLSDGWKQRWDFSIDEYEHTKIKPNRPFIEQARRLSWRECARIQTFAPSFEPCGSVESKFNQIGNAVPPLLAKVIIGHLLSGKGLVSSRRPPELIGKQLALWS